MRIEQTRMRSVLGRRSGLRGAFTLVEILIVVVILGILGAVVVPRYTNASQLAKENTLKDELRYLRTQLVVYKAQHRDVPPGYPAGNRNGVPTADDFLKQMTGVSDELGNVGAASAKFRLGPYLSKMPENPLNGLSTVTVVANGQAMPPAGMPNGSTGWIYKPQTLEIVPNVSGVDADGIRYIDY